MIYKNVRPHTLTMTNFADKKIMWLTGRHFVVFVIILIAKLHTPWLGTVWGSAYAQPHMTNIRPDRDSNPVLPGHQYRTKPIGVSQTSDLFT